MMAKWGKKGKETVGGSVQPDASKPERISNKLEHVLVAESKAERGAALKQRAKQLTDNKQHMKIAGAVAGGIVLLTIGWYVLGGKETSVVIDDGPRCTYAMLEESKPNFAPKKIEKLAPQAREIEQIPGYDTDVNCLYVVLTYYINLSDAAKARELYDKLAQVYAPEEGYHTVIVDEAVPPAKLKPTVEFLEQQAERYKNVGPDGAPR